MLFIISFYGVHAQNFQIKIIMVYNLYKCASALESIVLIGCDRPGVEPNNKGQVPPGNALFPTREN